MFFTLGGNKTGDKLAVPIFYDCLLDFVRTNANRTTKPCPQEKMETWPAAILTEI